MDESSSQKTVRRSERINKSKRPAYLRDFVSEDDQSYQPLCKMQRMSKQNSPIPQPIGVSATIQNEGEQMALKGIETLITNLKTDQEQKFNQIRTSYESVTGALISSKTEVSKILKLIVELKADVNNNTAAITALQNQIIQSSSTSRAVLVNSTNNIHSHTSHQEADLQSETNSIPASTISSDQSVELLTRQISQSITTALGSHRKLIPLPKFNGDADKWPQFIAQFDRTTDRETYSTEDNITRLEQSLEGRARDLIASLLIHHENVPKIIDRLRSRFGNPDQLVSTQLAAIRKFEAIQDDQLYKIVPFADQVLNLRSFLESAGCTDHLSSPSLLKELEEKLPYRERIAWAGYSLSLRPPTVKGFSDWILILADQIHRVKSKDSDEKRKKGKTVLHLTTETESRCIVCEEVGHLLTGCSKFKDMNYNDRWGTIKNNNMCFGCLQTGHQVFQCKSSKRCGVESCPSKHHELLHGPQTVTTNSQINSTTTDHPRHERLLNFEAETVQILFKVLPVKLAGPTGTVETFAFLDEGSSVTLVNRDVADKIGANGVKGKLKLRWFGNKESEENVTITNLQISGAFLNAKQFPLNKVHIVNDLKLPQQTLNLDQLSYKIRSLKKLPIQKYENAVPSILIGLDNAYLGVARNKQWDIDHGPIVCLTKLGYVVYGPTGANEESTMNTNHFLAHARSYEDDLQSLVKRYFTTEDFGVKVLPLVDSKEDIRAKYILESTTKLNGERYESGLLWKDEVPKMPNNFQMALKRLESGERKIEKNADYGIAYHKIMADYFSSGYAKQLSESEISHPEGPVWYLPHFGIMNPNKSKLRLVFDAAASYKGVSLNSRLLPGPDLNQPLIKVLSLFREKKYGVCADIKEMFHQVLIRNTDKDAQRFLYRPSPNHPVKVCRMEVMTFGSTCSPVTAQFVKNQNALKFVNEYPDAVYAILENHYVDDFVCSFHSEEEAIRISEDVKRIHMVAGFKLRGFISNSEYVSSSLNQCEKRQRSLNLDMESLNALVSDKILGLHWCTELDVFMFRLKFHKIEKEIIDQHRLPTKREFLAIIMSIFDPFGFLANYVIHMKILLQRIWKSGIDWDETIPDEYQNQWSRWWSELSRVRDMRIPRCLSRGLSKATSIEWHTLVDASESAFSAVCYILVKYANEENDVAFITGKTKCAPLKHLSIPRLELQAAVLGVRLASTFSSLHSFKVNKFRFWSDSKTVLFWIKDEKRRYRQFVSNRIAEILESTIPSDWYWVPSSDNVADDATRNSHTPSLKINSRWILGPNWLKNEEWPTQPKELIASSSEAKLIDEEVINQQRSFVILVNHPIIPFYNYSDLQKLKRHTAWLIRFVDYVRNKRIPIKTGYLSASELNRAELVLCRLAQQEVYSKEYQALVVNKAISKSSSIYRLSPYLDDDKVMRVYGRIDNAPTIPLFTKRPIILPKTHHFTELIVQSYHESCGHQFDELVVAEIRRKFWINGIRTIVQSKKKKCISCKIFYAKPSQPLMGQIPRERLTPFVRPFSFTGVDYFGPISVSIGRRREKRWVALFTCLTVRAVHLEISQDLSSDSFILCLKNLMNLRGIPVVMYSDNGSNIVGARNEIIRSSEFFENCGIKRVAADKGITWKFNNPADPAAGGCWERLVQSIKRVLKRIMQDTSPKVETLRSFLIEAANIVNSRPLTDVPIRSMADDVLTPNSFLIGCPNWIQTPGPTNDKLWCLKKQWRILESLKNHFWTKWINDYLPTLTRRSKWFERTNPLKVGDVVLVCDSDLSRRDWPKGVISRVIEGKDHQVRSVIVTVNGRELRRPASKIALLDISNTSSDDDEELRGEGCHLGQ